MPTKTDARFDAELTALADLAKALGHPARLQIVKLLAERKACVCGDIVDRLPLAQATVSQHLKELKRVGLVTGTISGPRTCYCLDRDAVARAGNALSRLFHDIDCCSTDGGNDEGCR